jgi:hypothetical protein
MICGGGHLGFQIITKNTNLIRDHSILYKLCVFYVDRNSKMTTTAGHSFYIEPIGSFYNQVNDTGSWEPLVYLCSPWNKLNKRPFNDYSCTEWVHSAQ